jgi:FlaA1/EpsC-like NDP-sugar epimerase
MADAFLAIMASFLGICLRLDFDFDSIRPMMTHFVYGIPLLALSVMIIFYSVGIYKIMWAYAAINDVVKTVVAVLLPFVFQFVFQEVTYDLLKPTHRGMMKVSGWSYPLAILLAVVFILALRMCIRRKSTSKSKTEKNHPVMIIGAGDAGANLYRNFANHPEYNYQIVCFVDDSCSKIGRQVYGIPVVGNRYAIMKAVEEYEIKTIIFAIPSCPSKDKTEILNICSRTKCELKLLPSIDQMLDGQIRISDVRKVELDDLLGRDPIAIDVDTVAGYVEGKTILVTGAGGSIGSELSRQIASHHPKQLILFDVYENTTYEILQELKRTYPSLDVKAWIGSVRDEVLLDRLFATFQPQIVYHAAAHKHVPLMEDSPNESVKNNVLGTLRIVRMSDHYKVNRFVLISTDKAVNPTNIMGATKRICEMIIQCYNQKSETEFVAVRFGNVLGSNGSVIPLFKRQIEEGGPLTVTHREIIRYFMTIPEAVSLVLQAGATAKGGEIFVLDMGKPVRIIDLAENLIRLSGFEPYKDINIVFTGLRPGEKLYEELLMNEEGLQSTENKLIYIGKPIDIQEDTLFAALEELDRAANREDPDIRAYVQKIVPTYHPNC